MSVILNEELPLPVRENLFDGSLIAIDKKDAELRQIAVGYTLHRVAATCANPHAIKRTSEELQSVQVGAGVSCGAEAAVHSVRRLVSHLLDDHVFVKLDFANAFNIVRRVLILASPAHETPELYRFGRASLEGGPRLTY